MLLAREHGVGFAVEYCLHGIGFGSVDQRCRARGEDVVALRALVYHGYATLDCGRIGAGQGGVGGCAGRVVPLGEIDDLVALGRTEESGNDGVVLAIDQRGDHFGPLFVDPDAIQARPLAELGGEIGLETDQFAIDEVGERLVVGLSADPDRIRAALIGGRAGERDGEDQGGDDGAGEDRGRMQAARESEDRLEAVHLMPPSRGRGAA